MLLCVCVFAFAVPAGDVYEHAVLLALKSQSEAALESSFTQLKTFYADTRCVGRICEKHPLHCRVGASARVLCAAQDLLRRHAV